MVDLVAVREACAPVVQWYEQFLSEGHGELDELEDALAALRRLPRLGGRLGRAVTTLASGVADASSSSVLDAFRQVQQASGDKPNAGPHASRTQSPAFPGKQIQRTRADQVALPGLN